MNSRLSFAAWALIPTKCLKRRHQVKLCFKPGLVGGHCIGVDPYYLIQKAQSVGYYPDILLACRRINDAMGQHVASESGQAHDPKGLCHCRGSCAGAGLHI